ncbi:MAG: hypothetical protein OHK0052_00180 [Anaerolineales bacterium]
MLNFFRNFFSPVTFEDEVKTRQAQTLNIINIMLLLLNLLATIAALVNVFPKAFMGSALAMTICIIFARWLTVRGSTTLAGVSIVVAGWATLFTAVLVNGLSDLIIQANIIIVLVSALLFGVLGQLLVLMLLVGSHAILFWLISQNLFTLSMAVSNPYDSVFTLGVVSIGTLGLMYVANNSARVAVQRARVSEQLALENARSLETSRTALQLRTNELSKLAQQLSQQSRDLETRNQQLQAIAELSQRIVAIRDLDDLLSQTTRMISERFAFYHVGIFLLDPSGKYAVLRAANSEGGRRMLARGHQLAVGQQGIVGNVTATGKPRIALDVGQDATFFNNPDLPHTHSEMALPLLVGNTILGALDVQSMQEAAFTDEDIEILQVLANQLATAIENARLFSESRASIEALNRAFGDAASAGWGDLLRAQPNLAYVCDTLDLVNPAKDHWPPDMRSALERGEPVFPNPQTLDYPLRVRDTVLGVVRLQKAQAFGVWLQEEVDLVAAMLDQMGQALETARLYTDTRRRAERERLTAQITARLRTSNDPQEILQTALIELRHALGAQRAQVLYGQAPLKFAQQPQAPDSTESRVTPQPQTPDQNAAPEANSP